MRLDIVTVIDNLLLVRPRSPRAAQDAPQWSEHARDRVLDEHGKQVAGR